MRSLHLTIGIAVCLCSARSLPADEVLRFPRKNRHIENYSRTTGGVSTQSRFGRPQDAAGDRKPSPAARLTRGLRNVFGRDGRRAEGGGRRAESGGRKAATGGPGTVRQAGALSDEAVLDVAPIVTTADRTDVRPLFAAPELEDSSDASSSEEAPEDPQTSPADDDDVLQPAEQAADNSTVSPAGLDLPYLENAAIANNPALAQLAARIEALRGRWIQVGLKPNPVTGYVGEEIGNEGDAGLQGHFLSQQFVTAGKLGKARAVVAEEIRRQCRLRDVRTLRVLTDVRARYFAALVEQRRVELSQELVELTGNSVSAVEKLLAGGEARQADLIQAQIEVDRAEIALEQARRRRDAVWRELAAIVGLPGLPVQPLEGEPETPADDVAWNDALARLLAESPEIAVAEAGVIRARRGVNLARARAIPDVQVQVSILKDTTTNDTVAGVQIGMPLPIHDRNQGGVREAWAETNAAERNVDRIRRDLERRLAVAFRDYETARVRADRLSKQIIPRARRGYSLALEGYTVGQFDYLNLLSVQRTLFETRLSELNALADVGAARIRIDGLLLDGGLDELDGGRGPTVSLPQ